MATRLIIPSDQKDPTPDRDDDLESFWHVLLWIVLRHCEHHLMDSHILTCLHTLFDCGYIDAGQRHGGDHKLAKLVSTRTIKNLTFDSNPLFNILVRTATVLAVRYPQSREIEEQMSEVEDNWIKFQSENPDLQISDLESMLNPQLENPDSQVISLDKKLFKMYRSPVFHDWIHRKRLHDPEWAVKVLDTPSQ